MSHHALQQALVIALHDPEFVNAVHADPDRALAGAGIKLEAREQAQLLAVDRRAWATDPLRRRRVLRVLAEELKVATTLALAETRSMAFAEAFFASPFFRRAVVEREALAPAFGDYLADAAASGRLTAPQLPDVIRLETASARSRRGWSGVAQASSGSGTRERERARERERSRSGSDSGSDSASDSVRLAPGVVLGRFNAGVLDAIQRVERYLFELSLMPQAALCDDRPALPDLPEPTGEQHLLFTGAGGGVGITAIDGDLFGVLSCLATPVPAASMTGALAAAGVPAGRAAALVDSLMDEGLLARGPL